MSERCHRCGHRHCRCKVKQEVNAITTGVFQVPANISGGPTDIINILIENPSSKRRTIYFMYDVSDITTYGINAPVISTTPFKFKVNAHSTQIHGLSAQSPGSLADSLFRFLFWGDIDLNEKKDKLSIAILAGTSSSSSLDSPKLSFGSLLFRHENFVKTQIKIKRDHKSVSLKGNSITLLGV